MMKRLFYILIPLCLFHSAKGQFIKNLKVVSIDSINLKKFYIIEFRSGFKKIKVISAKTDTTLLALTQIKTGKKYELELQDSTFVNNLHLDYNQIRFIGGKMLRKDGEKLYSSRCLIGLYYNMCK